MAARFVAIRFARLEVGWLTAWFAAVRRALGPPRIPGIAARFGTAGSTERSPRSATRFVAVRRTLGSTARFAAIGRAFRFIT